MRILAIDRTPPGDGRLRQLARFDLEVNDSLRLCNMRLVETPDGRRLSYAPSAGGKRAATFAPHLAASITNAAVVALNKMEAGEPDDREYSQTV